MELYTQKAEWMVFQMSALIVQDVEIEATASMKLLPLLLLLQLLLPLLLGAVAVDCSLVGVS